MTAPYYEDEYLTLLQGDAAQVLATLPDGAAQTCITSPPYFGLRDYGTGDAQIGLEDNPEVYVARLVEVFRQVRRVLRQDGTLWLNLGDSYAYPPGSAGRQGSGQRSGRTFTAEGLRGTRILPPKNLVGIPWKVAFALQADGWTLRNAIVWDKPNAMPSSVEDRLSTTYELVFLLSRSRRYYFDLDAIREPLARPEALNEGIVFGGRGGGEGKVGAAARTGGKHRSVYGDRPDHSPGTPPQTNCSQNGNRHAAQHPKGRNPGDVWTIPTTPYPDAHFAAMAPELARRCIIAGCPEGGTVLDPFIDSGTTAMVANRHGRRTVGIDLSEAYLSQVMKRRKDAPLPFGEVS